MVQARPGRINAGYQQLYPQLHRLVIPPKPNYYLWRQFMLPFQKIRVTHSYGPQHQFFSKYPPVFDEALFHHPGYFTNLRLVQLCDFGSGVSH